MAPGREKVKAEAFGWANARTYGWMDENKEACTAACLYPALHLSILSPSIGAQLLAGHRTCQRHARHQRS
eukprot:357254-Chlamydomonas_euryale.AAC.3